MMSTTVMSTTVILATVILATVISTNLSAIERSMTGPKRKQEDRGGFTMVELLVAMAIITLLMGVLLPAIASMREASRKMTCVNNLKNIALALDLYHDSNECLPFGAATSASATDQFTGHEWRASGFTSILPQLELWNLYKLYNFNCGTGGCKDIRLGDAAQTTFLSYGNLQVYRCPSGPSGIWVQPRDGHLDASNSGKAYASSYCFNTGRKWGTAYNQYFTLSLAKRDLTKVGPFSANSSTRKSQFLDGLSTTFLVGEADQNDTLTDPAVCCRNDEAVNESFHAFWTEGDHHSMRSTEWEPFPSIADCVYEMGPKNWKECAYVFGSQHRGGLHMALADGSARFFNDQIDISTWQRMGSMQDRQLVAEY